MDCDTGKQTHAAEYPLADSTYSKLLLDLKKHDFSTVTPELRTNILSFYSDRGAFHKQAHKRWKQTEAALAQLRSSQNPPVAGQSGSSGN
jgi:hypothetical protein